MRGLKRNRDWQYYFVNMWNSPTRRFPDLLKFSASRTDNYEVRWIAILGFIFGMREENIDYLLDEVYRETKK